MSSPNIVRAITGTGDWTFGNGLGDYLSGAPMVAQNITTRLRSFIGDCFFDLGAGVDWFHFMSSKDPMGLDLAIRSVIINTDNVTGVVEVSSVLATNRHISFVYSAATVYGTVSQQFAYSVPSLSG